MMRLRNIARHHKDTSKGQPMQASAEIRRTREQLGITQEQFARMMDVSTATVQRWEAGRARPGSPRVIGELLRMGAARDALVPEQAKAVAR
jgi:DNA-binding transcriptional regulator YiaG